jgi:hypothetical protein
MRPRARIHHCAGPRQVLTGDVSACGAENPVISLSSSARGAAVYLFHARARGLVGCQYSCRAADAWLNFPSQALETINLSVIRSYPSDAAVIPVGAESPACRKIASVHAMGSTWIRLRHRLLEADSNRCTYPLSACGAWKQERHLISTRSGSGSSEDRRAGAHLYG